MTDETDRALIPYDPDRAGYCPEDELRYRMDEVDALTICRQRFKELHKKYHTGRRELAATVYAIAVRLLHNEAAQIRLLSTPFFTSNPPGKFETPRDLFRVIWRYVTKEDPKLASKYGAVLWHLYQKKLHPEQAAEAIRSSGGIEKAARVGLYSPPYVDVRDIGDGRDADGNTIWYPDKIKPKTVEPEMSEQAVRMRSEQRIFDFVGNAEADEGTVLVVMTYKKTSQGPLLEVKEVEGADRTILPVLITDIQARQIGRVPFGKRARINVKKVAQRDGTIHDRATVVSRMSRTRA